MKKIVAIAFSDIHLNEWPEFNNNNHRLHNSLLVIRNICRVAKRNDVPVLFGGDLVHKYKSVTNSFLSITLPLLHKYSEAPIWAISGNHDQSEKNTRENGSPSYVETFSHVIPNLHCIDWLTKENQHLAVHGVPYITGNIGFTEYVNSIKLVKGKMNILMLHTDLHGATTPQGMDLDVHGIPEDMDSIFGRFDLVISGHIHKPAQLGPNIYMMGAPEQQNRGDAGTDMGYWVIYDDASMEFVKVLSPQFKFYNEGEETNDYDFWTLNKVDEGEIREEKAEKLEFDVNTSKTKLGRNYCKANNITDKKKRIALKKALGND